MLRYNNFVKTKSTRIPPPAPAPRAPAAQHLELHLQQQDPAAEFSTSSSGSVHMARHRAELLHLVQHIFLAVLFVVVQAAIAGMASIAGTRSASRTCRRRHRARARRHRPLQASPSCPGGSPPPPLSPRQVNLAGTTSIAGSGRPSPPPAAARRGCFRRHLTSSVLPDHTIVPLVSWAPSRAPYRSPSRSVPRCHRAPPSCPAPVSAVGDSGDHMVPGAATRLPEMPSSGSPPSTPAPPMGSIGESGKGRDGSSIGILFSLTCFRSGKLRQVMKGYSSQPRNTLTEQCNETNGSVM